MPGQPVARSPPTSSTGSPSRGLRSHPAVVAVEVEGDRLVVRSTDSDAVARLLLVELGGRNLEVTSGSLEDAFVHLTHGDAPVVRRTSDPVGSVREAR